MVIGHAHPGAEQVFVKKFDFCKLFAGCAEISPNSLPIDSLEILHMDYDLIHLTGDANEQRST